MSVEQTRAEAEAMELLRVWVEGDSLQCTLQADAFDDPGVWGEVLADVVRHIANALTQEGTPVESIAERIREVFVEEMRSSTNPPP